MSLGLTGAQGRAPPQREGQVRGGGNWAGLSCCPRPGSPALGLDLCLWPQLLQPGPQGKAWLGTPVSSSRTARQACLPSGLLCGPWLVGAVGKEMQEGGPEYAPTPEVGASSASGLWPSLVLSHSGCSMAALCPPHAQWGNLQSWCPGSPVPSVDQGTGGRACCPAVSPPPPPPRSLQTMHHTLTGPALCPTHIYTHTRIWACTPPTQRSSPRSLTYTHVYTRCA